MKKLFFIGLTTLSIFLIYLTTVDKKIYYLNLGDSVAMGVNSYKTSNNGYDKYVYDYLKKQEKLEKYITEFNEPDLRISDLHNLIENNYQIEINGHNQTLKNALIKADLVTLSIGNDDFYQKLKSNYTTNEMYDIVDNYVNDMEELLLLIKKYCKEDVVMLGYYDPVNNLLSEKIVTYMNKKMEDLTSENKIKYINLQKIIKNSHLLNPSSPYVSNNAYQKIGSEIIKIIKKEIL